MIIKHGATRTVILTKKYAFKFPYIRRYKNFLLGLLANMQELEFDSLNDERLAKVIYHLPCGFLIVMKRAEPLTWFDKKFLACFCAKRIKGFALPVELKQDSFGYIDGKLVAIDYG